MTQSPTIFSSTIFSGIRPTGVIHMGNYFGAITQWVKLQNEAPAATRLLFCIVDLHAITTLNTSDTLSDHCLFAAAAYLACGIDPQKSTIFLQSHVPAHVELAWLLGCVTPMGWLNRMTQFKDKAGKHKDQAVLGLYAYPVLQAADILSYQATHVPVGEDQKQHIELARDIAGAFNHRYGDVFVIPEPVIQKEGARVMSLRDGTKKMSKSDISDYTRIDLMDSNDLIAQKIKKAKTDPLPLPETMSELEGRPEAKNLLEMYALCNNAPLEAALRQFGGKVFSVFKDALIDAVVARFSPIRGEMNRLLKDPHALKATLHAGQDIANAQANVTLAKAKQAIKLLLQA